MAGFADNKNAPNGLSKILSSISSLGMRYEDLVIKNSQAVGITEAEFGQQGYMPTEYMQALAAADVGEKKFISFFDQGYKDRRSNLRKFAMNAEIEFMIETIADEAVVYDDRNFFARVITRGLREHLADDAQEEIIDYIEDSFKKIYSLFHFQTSNDGWSYMKQFLIDGFLAFEIVFDKEAKNIVGFKELDPTSLMPGIKEGSQGKLEKTWTQYPDNPSMKRELSDSQIIYLSYAKSNFVERLSYVERLIRSFNLLRIMENSRIIWNIMNSSYRLKMIVPIGNKSPQKARESLAEMMSIYKEDINLNFDSGELTVNGKPSLQFYKNYLFPSKNGESPEIETISGDGPDLSDTEALQYFHNKLRLDSKIPFSRFDKENPGEFSADASNINREEIRFGKFINRLRNGFQEILLKPLWIQLTLKYPELKDDMLTKSNLALEFNKDNVFEEMKSLEILSKRAELIQTLQGIMISEVDSSGMPYDVPFINAKFAVHKYLKLDSDDIALNAKYTKEQQEHLENGAKKAAELGM